MLFLLEKKDFNGFKNFSVQKLLNDWYLPSHGDNTSDYCSVQQQLPQSCNKDYLFGQWCLEPLEKTVTDRL